MIHVREVKQMSTTTTENHKWIRKTKNNKGTLKQSLLRSVLPNAGYTSHTMEVGAGWHG